MEPSPPKTYPFPCQTCLGRFQCHCSILEAAGYCVTCKTYPCSYEPDNVVVCEKCRGRLECVCDLLIAEGHCSTCLMMECQCHLPYCFTCKIYYDPIDQGHHIIVKPEKS